jgi:hypothetical protein
MNTSIITEATHTIWNHSVLAKVERFPVNHEISSRVGSTQISYIVNAVYHVADLMTGLVKNADVNVMSTVYDEFWPERGFAWVRICQRGHSTRRVAVILFPVVFYAGS